MEASVEPGVLGSDVSSKRQADQRFLSSVGASLCSDLVGNVERGE